MHLRAARPEEAPAISELALRSKAHWGYDAAFLEAVRDELTLPPAACDGVRVVVASQADVPLGFYRIGGEPPDGVLDDLFVDVPVIGTGVGAILLRDALVTARRLGYTTLVIDSDPGAEPFYLHHGAVRVGEVPSGSVPGRMLPRLRVVL